MNDFKENLKYNTSNLSHATKKETSLPHKVKKVAMIGGLSLMAAISSVGCSKSTSQQSVEILEQTNFENSTETELSKNDKAKERLIKDTQELIQRIENYSGNELSDDDYIKLENLLSTYVFIETSSNYGGNIPYTSIIPEKQNSQLIGTFYINNDEKKNIKNYILYEDRGLVLDTEATQLYNEYYSNILGSKSLLNALSTLYKIEVNLTKENEQLINNLSYDETVNLMKSSYVSAYNNMLAANNNYNPVETYEASDFILYVNQEENEEYSLSSYIIDDNGNHTLFETTLDTKNVKVIDDYLDAYTVFYDNDSNISGILSSLKIANEKNQVSEDELVEQLTSISLHPEKMNAYLKTTGLQKDPSETTEKIDDERY